MTSDINNSTNDMKILAENDPAPAKPPYIVNKTFEAKKLIKGLEYNYEIEVYDSPGNWPVVVIPRSGSFIADSRNKKIEATLIFCPNTTICNTNNNDVLPYNLDYSCGLKNNKLLFTNLRLKVDEKDTARTFYSSGQYVECLNCLNNPKVSLSGATELNDTTKNSTTIKAKIEDIIPGETYSWAFSKTASNWPATISPISGSFIALDKTYSFDSVIAFCKDASCSGAIGYVDFDDDHLSYLYKHINLNFTISSEQNCYLDDANTSLNIYCKDCIPLTSISFNQKQLDISTSNCSDLEVSVSGLDVNQGYDYYFTSHYANWPITITPISGSFITSNNTSTTIPFKVSFCGSEILCSGNPNVLNYNIDYNKIYTDTECSKYAYIKYNLKKSSSFSIQSNNFIIPDNPVVQSDFLKMSCYNCLESTTKSAPIVLSTSPTPVITGIIVPTGSTSGNILT